MKKLFPLILLMLSCVTPEDNKKEAHQIANNIIYYKDLRTNLCFVDNAITVGENMWSPERHIFSYVPCTPEVEKFVKNL